MISTLLVPILSAALVSAPTAGQESAAETAVALERTQAHIAAALEQPGCVGLSVAIALGDRMLVEAGYGIAELEHGVRAEAGTMFRIGSITKQFTAAALVQLAEDGRLGLDEALHAFLPDYPTGGHEVTLRHLLTHTSGIANYTALGESWQRTIALELSDEELVSLFANVPFDFRPGTAWNYSNSGYYLAGMILERVTKTSYAEHLRATFFTPLGLTRTRYGSNIDLIPGRAQGYQLIDGRLANDALIGMRQPGAAGGLLSTAGDLVRWQRALVSGQVVTPESHADMVTPYMLEDGRETGYGLGLQLDEHDGVARVHHGGGINGFNSELAYYPTRALSVAVISNSEGFSAGNLADELAGFFLGE